MEIWKGLTAEQTDWLQAGLIFGAFVAAAIVDYPLVQRAISNSVKNHELADRFVKAGQGLGFWALILLGLNYSLKSLNYVQNHAELSDTLSKWIGIAWAFMATVVTARVASTYISYRAKTAREHDINIRDQAILARKLTTAVIAILGGLFMLRIGGVDITPVLAGGALSGLVLGLALQDSLSNVFAGLFLNADKSVRLGDLIRLMDGSEGFLNQIGWRNTTLQMWDDTMLTVPNSDFAKSRFINMSRPHLNNIVRIDFTARYDEDLDAVEAAALRAAAKVQEKYNGENKAAEPFVRFRAITDTSISFRAFIPIYELRKRAAAASDFIKWVHQEFKSSRTTVVQVDQKIEGDDILPPNLATAPLVPSVTNPTPQSPAVDPGSG